MCTRAIDCKARSRTTRRLRASAARRGNALLGSLVVLVGIIGLLYATSAVSTDDVKEARRGFDKLRTKYLAEAGVQRGMLFLSQQVAANSLNPLETLNDLFLGGPTISPIVGEPVLDGTSAVGSITVSLTSLEQTPTSITIAIDASGYLPVAPTELAAGEQVASWKAMRTTVRYALAPSHVFDYGYFINNWGWFYGDTITCNGNVRSNGQFDVAGYAPTITGQPLYDEVNWNGSAAELSGYQDDNGDGLLDGKDGGVWAGWDISGAQNVQGQGGSGANQHEFQGAVEMPNLSDFSRYEYSAKQQGGSISIAGVQVTNAVYGDESGERQNLYLVGTPANPIVLNGPVVVRGDVIIKGTVTGQGAIYSGGNVYCPDSVQYANPPATKRPADSSQAANEQWLTTNWNKDFLGLFARENVVIGDHTNALWQYYEAWWMSHSMNQSAEDAGADGIPNTKAGRDGILGTADDDLLEGDGVFTIEHYTQADYDLGRIPPGKNIGDSIAGTGEDIDGDGAYDDATTLSDVVLTTPLNTANWGGNMPLGGVSSYSSIASLYAANFDAVFYTNHSFCYLVLGSAIAKINGAVVSRNENIIYGTPSIEINHDARLLGGASGRAARLLPSTLEKVEVLRQVTLDRDPNRYVVSP